MGLLYSKLYNIYSELSKGEPSRNLMLGLDAAGKSTLLYKMKLNEIVCTIPTIGFKVKTVSPCKGVTFTVWDVGGQDKIRRLWQHYYQNTQGLIFVVDSADQERIQEAYEELSGVLHSDEMRGVPVVVLANKQDLPGALPPHELIEKLRMGSFSGHKWHVQPSCATTGDGVYEGMEALARLVKEERKSGRHR